MAMERIEVNFLRLPYVHFFETSFGRAYDRTFIVIRAYEEGLVGYGECVAEEKPLYSGETTETAWHVLKDFLIPLVFNRKIVEPDDFYQAAGVFRENRMAKAGLELALWDLKAKKQGLPLSRIYGGVRDEIPAGVSVGIEDSVNELLARIENYLAQGYERIKIKIKPGWDVDICQAIREKYPDLLLQADANGCYSFEQAEHLKKLDAFNLLMVEQPFPPYDLWDHSRLQRMMTTPICLDESVISYESTKAALEMGSCRIVNIKVGRVGGMVEARKIHDYCQRYGVGVWCGGMLESGIGRAHNLHIATLPNFKYPNDLSASARYYQEDLIEPPITLSRPGHIRVPEGAGIGVNPVEERIEKASLKKEVLRP